MRKLIILFNLSTLSKISYGQVGINTENPSQTLDVNGQIQVGQDNLLPNEEGSLCYNNVNKDLEGFVQGQWQSLTTQNQILGENAQYVQIYDFGVGNNSTWQFFDQSKGYDSATGATTSGFLPVPSSKILVIDQVYVTATTANPSYKFFAGVRKSNTNGIGVNPQVYITGSSQNGNSCLQANKAPLLVINSGNTVQAYNGTSSDVSVKIIITGFLLNNLQEYYGL